MAQLHTPASPPPPAAAHPPSCSATCAAAPAAAVARLRSDAEMRCAKEMAASPGDEGAAVAGALGLPLPEGVSGDIGTVRIALETALAMPDAVAKTQGGGEE